MRDDIDDFAPLPNQTGKPVVAGALSVVLAGSGLYFFIRDWAYFEYGQLALMGVYCCLVALFFYAILKIKIFPAFLSILLCFGLVMASQQKYEWRKSYIDEAMHGKPFPLEAYIDHYPSYEEYLAAPYLGYEDWVRFNRTCVESAMNGRQPDPACASPEAIKANFNIDIVKVLKEYRARMARTAVRIQKGQIAQKRRYERCLSEKQCVEVPLLPAGVDADKIDPQSDDYLEIRRPFWQLINSSKLTPEICNYMTLCKAMVQTGILHLDPKG